MSNRPIPCEQCQVPGEFVGVGPFSGAVAAYTVAWKCPKCQRVAADVCPIGPLVPTSQSCLNCGADIAGLAGSAPCRACGTKPAEAHAFLGVVPGANSLEVVPTLMEKGLLRAAMASLNEHLIREPQNVKVWAKKVWLLNELRMFPQALRVVAEAFPNGVPALLRFGQAFALQESGQIPAAIEAYRNVLAAERDENIRGVARGNLANALATSGDDAGAEAAYRLALQESPATVPTYGNYSRFLLDRKRWSDALAILDKALMHAGTNATWKSDLLADKALIHAEQGQAEAALECAVEAVRLRPDSVRAIYLRGRAHALLGHLDEALADIDTVLRLDPGNADATRAKPMIEAARPKPWWKFWS